ncbi:MAG TPA: response regulator transcription factor [Chitinophagaceae bacterium]|nr:response regulator transcription factor [Chitinophagaceae bacterium]
MVNESKNKIKVVLADDHVLLRSALASLIDSFEDCTVVAQVSNGQELIKSFELGINPEVILLDLNMPVMDGVESAKWLQVNHPEIHVLMLTMYDSDQSLIRLLQVGVKGFLKKDIHPSELHFALQSVMQSGFYYSHNTTGQLVNLFRKKPDNPNFLEKMMLNDNDIAFLKLACTELTYKEIAMKMNLNPRSVDNLRDHLFEKLSVKSRVGLAMFAIRHGLVSI